MNFIKENLFTDQNEEAARSSSIFFAMLKKYPVGRKRSPPRSQFLLVESLPFLLGVSVRTRSKNVKLEEMFSILTSTFAHGSMAAELSYVPSLSPSRSPSIAPLSSSVPSQVPRDPSERTFSPSLLPSSESNTPSLSFQPSEESSDFPSLPFLPRRRPPPTESPYQYTVNGEGATPREGPGLSTSSSIDKWSIIRLDDDDALVTVGSEPKPFARVEMLYLLFDEEQADIAEVQIYPYNSCGVGTPTLLGSSTIVCNEDEEDECMDAYNVTSGGNVVLSATFFLEDLGALEDTPLWDSQANVATFCGRVALTEQTSNTLVSFHDTDVEVAVDLSVDFAIANMDANIVGPDSLARSFVYQITACLCDNFNSCYLSIPQFDVGSDIRVCLFPPEDENVEIDQVWEWQLLQEDNGVSRYAFLNGENDALSSVLISTRDMVVMRTTLDAAFFISPESVALLGVVLMRPTFINLRKKRQLHRPKSAQQLGSSQGSSAKELIAEEMEEDNIFRNKVESGIFRLMLELEGGTDSEKEEANIWKGIGIGAFAIMFPVLFLVLFIAFRQQRRILRALLRENDTLSTSQTQPHPSNQEPTVLPLL